MPSDYPEMTLIYYDEYGRTQLFASATVKVRTDDDNYASDVATLTSDANGIIPTGTLSVPVGSRARFRIENYNSKGIAGMVTKITT